MKLPGKSSINKPRYGSLKRSSKGLKMPKMKTMKMPKMPKGRSVKVKI